MTKHLCQSTKDIRPLRFRDHPFLLVVRGGLEDPVNLCLPFHPLVLADHEHQFFLPVLAFLQDPSDQLAPEFLVHLVGQRDLYRLDLPYLPLHPLYLLDRESPVRLEDQHHPDLPSHPFLLVGLLGLGILFVLVDRVHLGDLFHQYHL